MYHPLVQEPVANSVTWRKNAMITGSNASGKSTFVKAMAINMIFAQTLGICHASKYQAKPSYIITSMAVKDSILQGNSYFTAEIKSLKRIVDAVTAEVRAVCFIDEILKGTNTMERIAASAAILNWLHAHNCRILVATHDMELSEMLHAKFDNYHFKEYYDGSRIGFDYRLYDGPAITRNAIHLLEIMAYPSAIISEANRLYNGFEQNRAWEVFK